MLSLDLITRSTCSSIAIALCLLTSVAEARVEAAAVLPHGDFAFDPTLLPRDTPERRAANEIAAASLAAGQWLAEHDPQVLFISTPHGIQLTNDYAIYLGSAAQGNNITIGLDVLHNATPYQIHYGPIPLAQDLSQDLVTNLTKSGGCGNNVSGILIDPNDATPMPLNWGEVIPLSIIPSLTLAHWPVNEEKLQDPVLLFQRSNVIYHKFIAKNALRRHIIWSHPSRRYDHAVEMVPELLRIGADLYEWMEGRPERFAVIVSGDLSHTHLQDGPYGYSNASERFDRTVGRWVTHLCGQTSNNDLLETARQLQPNAMSCGFTGFVLLHGMLCHNYYNSNNYKTRHIVHDDWSGRLLANRNATYYGMMAATFARKPRNNANNKLLKRDTLKHD